MMNETETYEEWKAKYEADTFAVKRSLADDPRFRDIYTRDEMEAVYVITSFRAPFCACTRLADGVKGTLQFGDFPRPSGIAGHARLYFNFVAGKAW